MQETVINRFSIVQIVTFLLFSQMKFTLPSTVSSRTLTSKDVSSSYPNNMHDWFGTEIVNENRTTCIKLHSALKVEMYINNETMTENVPITATAKGSCEELQQYIDLKWASTINDFDVNFCLTLYFEKEVKDLAENKYVLNAVNINWTETQNGSKFSGKNFMDGLKSFETSINHSFKCSDELSISRNELTIYFYNLQFQAFHIFNDSATDFGEEDTCPKDYRLKDMGKRLFSMISLLLGCVLLLFFLSWILQQILRRQCPVQFGYHNVN